MKPHRQEQKTVQFHFFSQKLEDIIDPSHAMVKLAKQINWAHFEKLFRASYCETNGRPAINTRLMVSVHYLKYAFNLSDESVIEMWVENPYWQYLSGMIHFEHKFPMSPCSMSRWRKRHGEQGAEEMLKETIQTGLRNGCIKKSTLPKINVDTTVSEKNIAFPTDGRLYRRSIERLVKEAKRDGLCLRQTYLRVSKDALKKAGDYAHARKSKLAAKQTKKLRTMLGCLIRDIDRKSGGQMSIYLEKELNLAQRLHSQKKGDKNKLYSLHEPETVCISKGKAHKKYELGYKVSLTVTTKDSWIVCSLGLENNPYDGHTLTQTLERSEQLIGAKIKEAFVDRGYKGHGYQGDAEIHIDRQRRGGLAKRLWKKMKHRAAVEPVIGHLKSDKRMGRNYLGGVLGNKVNATLSGAGYNFRKLLKLLFVFIFVGLIVRIKEGFLSTLPYTLQKSY